MEKILPGKYVEMTYDLYTVDADGKETLVHTIEPSDPERFIFGITPGMLPRLEMALDGLEKGASFNVSIPAADGFPFNPDEIVTLDRDIFLNADGKFDDEKIKVGEAVPMLTGDGYQITGKVVEITPEHVKMDFNHPLVGQNLRFDGKITEVRDAKPEELHPSCGGGCCGGKSEGGCGCDGGCDGCN